MECETGFSSRMAQPARAAGMATSRCSAVGLETITAAGRCFSKRLREIGFGREAGQLILWKAAAMRPKQNNIGFPQRHEIAEMTTPYRAQSGDEQFGHGCVASHYTVRVRASLERESGQRRGRP